MSVEDRLRSGLRSAAESVPTASGSLTDVQARAAQLQRRRTAMRGSAGVFALVVVAAIGVVTVRGGGSDDYATLTDADAAELDSTTVDAAFADEEMGDGGQLESEGAALASTASVEAAKVSVESAEAEEAAFESATADASVQADDQAADGGAADSDEMDADGAPDHSVPSPELEQAGELAVPEGSAAAGAEPDDGQLPLTVSPEIDADADAAVFADAVAVVAPPAGTDPADVRYSFGGGFVLAQAGDAWFAHDGQQWRRAEPPESPPAGPVSGGQPGPSAVVLNTTSMLGVAASVEVSGGVAWLKYGERIWELRPISDVTEAHAGIGWMGEHIAVIVGAPDQSLYMLERLE